MSSLPPPLQIDPNMIEDLINSRAYREAVGDYIRGRTEESIVITVLKLLKALMPMLFRGL